MATKLKINIVSDTICPWCFIGKRRLEKAISQFQSTNPGVSFDIEWHPYQLNPAASKTDPKVKLEHYKQKLGARRTAEMVPYMQSVGEPLGIKFSYGGLIANTLDSHRLIYWSKQFGKQDQVVEELFKDYFERERNIGDNQVLADAAGRAGLDKDKALEYLNSDADVKLLKEEVEKNTAKNMGGVPQYSIQNGFQFTGAQEPETFTAFFEKALLREREKHSL